MITLEEFQKDMRYLEELDGKIDEIAEFIGIENKITDVLFDCHNTYLDKVMIQFGDNEIIHDYISWWIFECGYGEGDTTLYDADTKEEIDNLETAERLYNYITKIEVVDSCEKCSNPDCKCTDDEYFGYDKE